LSLESKAKTLNEIYGKAVELYGERYSKLISSKELDEKLNTKWIRLEDCQKTVSAYEEQVFKLAVEKAELKKCLEKLPQTIDDVAKRIRQKLDLTRSSGVAVFDVAVSMLKDELNKETKP